ncbi:sigma-E factor negative regulatory protein [Litorilituus sediminis]|uniref:Transcriptional regulator n=1 Tax=Litorilituus sediminis TaxID=718192 RepID=A0A4P6P672_9GAMM|nr:RseA family anti-sigma factor [Litorilituus sediminis]QBG37091.1 transcriptional regulator [Litorilituus sediminis]
MSEGKFESMSSLVDDHQASKDEMLVDLSIDEILKDDELATSWQNYHLIGDVMRDEVAQSLQLDLTEQIADAIAKEATILSPINAAGANNSPEDNTLDNQATPQQDNQLENSQVISAENRFKAKVVKLFKPLGQVAIAASAAGLMIVGVQQNSANNTIESPMVPNQVVQTMPLTGFANPVSFNASSQNQQVNRKLQQQVANQKKNEQLMEQQRRFQALLADHQQQVKLTAGNKASELLEKK